MSSLITDITDASRLSSASAVSGLQPIAACPHVCFIAKNSALLSLWMAQMHSHMQFFQMRISRVRVRG